MLSGFFLHGFPQNRSYTSGIYNVDYTKGGEKFDMPSKAPLFEHMIVPEFPVLAIPGQFVTTAGPGRGHNCAEYVVYHLCVQKKLSEAALAQAAKKLWCKQNITQNILFLPKFWMEWPRFQVRSPIIHTLARPSSRLAFMSTRVLRIDHGRLASLLTFTPDRNLLFTLRHHLLRRLHTSHRDPEPLASHASTPHCLRDGPLCPTGRPNHARPHFRRRLLCPVLHAAGEQPFVDPEPANHSLGSRQHRG